MGDVVSIARYINEVKIEQRVKDGFVNATAMCVAYDKDVSDWLRTDTSFQLFCALSNKLGIKFNSAKKPNSVKTRIADTFSGLIVVKRGSPEFGGGTWIHPQLAIQLAQWCNPEFALMVSEWVIEWFATGFSQQYQQVTDFYREYQLYLQRCDVRSQLKDILRPELMEVVAEYAISQGLNPFKLCADVHDVMNIKIQGIKSKELKQLGGLPMADLIRDYFDANLLVMYSAINKLAKNNIVDKKIEPIKATEDACESYLGVSYFPKFYDLKENIKDQGKRLSKKNKYKEIVQPSNLIQLPLFDVNVI